MSRSAIRPHSAVAVVAALLAGCAIHVRPPEPDYRLSPGGIGVAVEPPVLEDLPTAASYAGKGALSGAVAPLGLAYAGPAGIAAGILLSPFTALYGAAKAGSCAQKFSDAYPPIADKLPDIVQREVLRADVAEAFAAELRKHTTAPVTTVDVPPASGQEQGGEPLPDSWPRDLAYVFIIKPKVQVEATAKCEQAEVAIRLRVTLWSVAEARPIGLRPNLFAWQRRSLKVAFEQLPSVFDEPAALRTRFIPEFRSWATDTYYHGGFDLAQ